jgi:hypothetical protein
MAAKTAVYLVENLVDLEDIPFIKELVKGKYLKRHIILKIPVGSPFG